eukprot:TRINITY_DN10689_c0_g5_i10.p2 TRINITY_DN10689_c0_g5~~TRINITY_DN10689_c0_g5_i10.p2  ORF type:complete len:197 (-),score=37.93 TRINITY_DN10689_c0_g5_i10:703-1293(-)
MIPRTTEGVIKLDVGGTYYTTSRATLCSDPNSVLAIMFSSAFFVPTKDPDTGRYVIDRDGKTFRYILNYLRDKTLLGPEEDKLDFYLRLYLDARYFNLEELQRLIEDKMGSTYLRNMVSRLDQVHRPVEKCLLFEGDTFVNFEKIGKELPVESSSFTIEAWIFPFLQKSAHIVGWGNEVEDEPGSSFQGHTCNYLR